MTEAADDAERFDATVFVYGTLTDPDRVADVVDDFAFRGRAVLEGLHVVAGRYPTLAPGGSVAGRLLAVDDVAALDAYEGVDRGLYARVPVPFADADGTLGVYVGDPDRLDVAEPVSWPGEGSLGERVAGVVADRDVCVRRVE
jgi:gamma-glutamylcyclotransferase (GGCT)/AIG2-like uncharacterized protein YtfP